MDTLTYLRQLLLGKGRFRACFNIGQVSKPTFAGTGSEPDLDSTVGQRAGMKPYKCRLAIFR